MEATSSAWGTLHGRIVERTLLRNGNGMSMSLSNYGATILSVKVPSRGGGPASEVTLCHTNLDDLRAHSPYYGCTVGRVANRTALGKYTVDGKPHTCAVNNGPNSLHGGVTGFDKVVWEATTYCTPSAAGVRFTYVSKDGEEGYPGTLTAVADYRLTEANEVRMEFSATTDAATPVNLCNHTYWNLCGDLRASVHDHVLQLHMPFYTPVDATSIPTGEVAPVAGTHFDFTAPTRIGDRIMGVDGGGAPGYDHNYVRSKDLPPGGFSHGLFPIARVTEATSGRSMVVESNAPGVQFYTVRWRPSGCQWCHDARAHPAQLSPLTPPPHTQKQCTPQGNWLGKTEKADPHRALCLETQNFPDAVNKPGVFPDPILRPGQTYSHITVHRFEW